MGRVGRIHFGVRRLFGDTLVRIYAVGDVVVDRALGRKGQILGQHDAPEVVGQRKSTAGGRPKQPCLTEAIHRVADVGQIRANPQADAGDIVIEKWVLQPAFKDLTTDVDQKSS